MPMMYRIVSVFYVFIDLEALHSFQNQMAVIQRDAVSWLHTIAPKMFDIKQTEYVHW